MSVLKVSRCTDISGLGGVTLSSGSITCNGTLRVTNININGSISGSSPYNIPSFSGQSGKFLSTNGTNLIWSSEIQSGGGGAGLLVFKAGKSLASGTAYAITIGNGGTAPSSANTIGGDE